MKTLITPVGTSLFRNYLDQNRNGGFSRNYERIKNCSASMWDASNKQNVIDDLKKTSQAFINKVELRASAELQSIANIQDKLNEDLTVRLLASDTIASRLAAEILKEQSKILKNEVSVKFNYKDDIIEGLQVDKSNEFLNRGMTNLIRKINTIANGDWLALAINITGGYKATLPYLAILAQLNRVPLYYNFEDTKELITVSPIPLISDWGWIHRYSGILKKVYDGISDWPKFKKDNPEVQDLEAFIEIDDKTALLSPIGEIFWKDYEDNFPVKINADIYFDKKVWRDSNINKVTQDLYKHLNEALSSGQFKEPDCFNHIDSLGSLNNLNHGGKINPNTFIFKSQKNNLPIRFAYSFNVQNNEIISVTIFDILRGKFDHGKYVQDFKTKYRNPYSINFVIRTLPKPL